MSRFPARPCLVPSPILLAVALLGAGTAGCGGDAQQTAGPTSVSHGADAIGELTVRLPEGDSGTADDPEPPDAVADAAPPPGSSSASCIHTASHVVLLEGDHEAYDHRDGFPSGTALDVTRAAFHGSASIATAFRLYEASDVCVSGGTFDNGVGEEWPWADAKVRTDVAFRYSPGVVLENAAVLRTGDGVSFGEGTAGWTFRSSYVDRAMDDVVENDYLLAGHIDDVLVDHAYAFVSSRVGSSRRGCCAPGGTLVVERSLVRLAPQNAADGGVGGGRLWKWEKYDVPGVTLVVRNNVFVFEPGDYAALYLDPADDPDVGYRVLLEAENNLVVWLGEGPFPARVPEGFRVVTDRDAWTDAREAWFDAHPRFEAYR